MKNVLKARPIVNLKTRNELKCVTKGVTMPKMQQMRLVMTIVGNLP